MNNLRKLFKSVLFNRLQNITVLRGFVFQPCHNVNTSFYKISPVSNLHPSQNFLKSNIKTILAVNVLTWLGFVEEDKDKESELITTLKRAVLCMQREQLDKAEQMLHLALRIAQQQQNQQGVLYCYDLMANLAFERRDLGKAEKLFVSVLQMLLANGTPQDDLKVIHVSLKLARIYQLAAELENAEIGYSWCLEQIKKKHPQNKDSKVLYGVVNDWYAQFLLDKNEVEKALIHLKEAHRICSEINTEDTDKTVLLLNDLGTTSFRADDMVNAEKYLKEAVDIGHKMDDKTHLGVVHANLGLILLEKGVIELAQKFCKEAWHLGRKHENSESINQANYCLDQIKLNLNLNK